MALLSSVIQSGTRAAQPAATAVAAGVLYFVTDEGELERSTGAAWVQVAVNETGHDTLDHTGLTGVGGSSTYVGARVYNNTTQSITSATWTALTFNSEEFDSDAFHDTVSNTSRLTVPTAKNGKYLLEAHGAFAVANVGQRWMKFRKNGTTELRGTVNMNNNGGSALTIITSSMVVDLVATDYVEVMVFQDHGSAVNIGSATTEYQSAFSISRLGT